MIWRVAGSVPSMGRQLKAAMPSDLKVKGGDEKREREREREEAEKNEEKEKKSDEFMGPRR